MPKDRHARFLLGLLYAGLGVGALWLCMRFLLPWLAPFLIALALAALLEPGVRLLSQRLHLPRWGASALCAGLLSPVFSQSVIDNLSFLGSILIFCVGINLAFGQKFRVANMLPALVIGAVYTALL